MGHTVGELAKIAHVSVRTLHHYDEIGLLTPSGRSDAGYRLYTDSDLERLQEVLFFRELGFALDAIGRILRDPEHDRRKALVAQRALLVETGRRLEAMVALVDRTLDAIAKGTTMTNEEMFEVFGDFNPKDYEEEARQRWGNTDAYAESARRTKGYTKDDWKRMRAEADAIGASLAEALRSGAAPGDPHVLDLVEQARLHIDRWFYPCSRAMHVSLGEMYVSDTRFAANYEKLAPGLAQFVCDAIRANAARDA
jgi:DNA-binding transcriptional MerR regulator